MEDSNQQVENKVYHTTNVAFLKVYINNILTSDQ